jgi:hypothetical protein
VTEGRRSLLNEGLYRYHYDFQIQENITGALVRIGTVRNVQACTKFWSDILMRRDHLETFGANEVVLRFIKRMSNIVVECRLAVVNAVMNLRVL